MDVETPAGDLARLIEDWLWEDPDGSFRNRAIAAYTKVRPLESVELDVIPYLIGSTSLLATVHWIRWHFVERRRFEDPQAVEGGIERGLLRLGLTRPSWS
jgi:homoserine kinase type II